MNEFLADFWSFLFDKLGVVGLMVAMIIIPVAFVLIIILIVVLIKLISRLLSGGRKTRSNQREVPYNNAKEVRHNDVQESPQDNVKKNNQDNTDAVKKSWESFQEKLQEEFKSSLQLAKEGDFKAQCEVGRMYYYGDGTKRDREEGLFWLKKSAEQGGVYARILLGRIYDQEKKFVDPGEVLDWLIPVAENGNDEAQYLLSRMYSLKFEHRKRTLGFEAGEWKEDELCMQWYDQNKYWLKTAMKNGNRDAMDLYF